MNGQFAGPPNQQMLLSGRCRLRGIRVCAPDGAHLMFRQSSRRRANRPQQICGSLGGATAMRHSNVSLLLFLPFLSGCLFAIHGDGAVHIRGTLTSPANEPIHSCRAEVKGGYWSGRSSDPTIDSQFDLWVAYAVYLWSGKTRIKLRLDCPGYADTSLTVEWAGNGVGWASEGRRLGPGLIADLGPIVLRPMAPPNTRLDADGRSKGRIPVRDLATSRSRRKRMFVYDGRVARRSTADR
jgi:hypothetical protein